MDPNATWPRPWCTMGGDDFQVHLFVVVPWAARAAAPTAKDARDVEAIGRAVGANVFALTTRTCTEWEDVDADFLADYVKWYVGIRLPRDLPGCEVAAASAAVDALTSVLGAVHETTHVPVRTPCLLAAADLTHYFF